MTEQAGSPEGSELYINLLKKCLTASLYDESAWRVVDGPMPAQQPWKAPLSFLTAKAKHALLSALRRRDLMVVRKQPYVQSIREQGLDWPCFGYTLTGTKRLENVQAAVEEVLASNVPGDFVETGVWRGGSTILMRALLKKHGVVDRKVWCCDSFEGMPVPNKADRSIDRGSDYSDRVYLAVSLEQVQANFRRFEVLDEQVQFLKGWFRETLPTAPIKQIALLRLDGDLYESTMDALTNLAPRVSPGGFVIVDDYNSWAGCRQAVDEYRTKHGITSKIIAIDAHAVYWRA
jgi:O-methyltransferase